MIVLIVASGMAGWVLARGEPSRVAARDRTPSALTPTPEQTSAPTAAPTARSTPTAGALDLDPPDGYTFDGGGVTTAGGTLTLGSDCTISGVDFSGGDLGLQITGSGNTIRDCTFGPYFRAALIVWVGNDNVIDGCTFNGVTGSGANIQVLGGKRNRITNNVTRGGITAIIFLYSRSANGGGRASLIEDNVVTGNTCSGFSEEGISFDVHGNSAEDAAALEYDRARSVATAGVTLSPLAFPSYLGYDMVFLSGALKGQTRSIVAQSGAAFTLTGSLAGVATNDEVVIGATFKRNLIAGNTVIGGGVGILLYGMAFGNRIENNLVLSAGIKVESIDNLVMAGASATRTYGRAPCGYNTVENNTVANADVSLEYYAIPTMNGHANTYSAYTSVGNNVIGNRCGRVNANEQYCYIAGNTGPPDFSNVTLSPQELVLP